MALFLWRYEIDPKLPVGSNFCLCGSCGEYFGGVKSFDTHRHGNDVRACYGPSVMRERGLELNSRGYWIRSWNKS